MVARTGIAEQEREAWLPSLGPGMTVAVAVVDDCNPSRSGGGAELAC